MKNVSRHNKHFMDYKLLMHNYSGLMCFGYPWRVLFLYVEQLSPTWMIDWLVDTWMRSNPSRLPFSVFIFIVSGSMDVFVIKCRLPPPRTTWMKMKNIKGEIEDYLLCLCWLLDVVWFLRTFSVGLLQLTLCMMVGCLIKSSNVIQVPSFTNQFVTSVIH